MQPTRGADGALHLAILATRRPRSAKSASPMLLPAVRAAPDPEQERADEVLPCYAAPQQTNCQTAWATAMQDWIEACARRLTELDPDMSVSAAERVAYRIWDATRVPA